MSRSLGPQSRFKCFKSRWCVLSGRQSLLALDTPNEPMATADSWRGRRPSDEDSRVGRRFKGPGGNSPDYSRGAGTSGNTRLLLASTGPDAGNAALSCAKPRFPRRSCCFACESCHARVVSVRSSFPTSLSARNLVESGFLQPRRPAAIWPFGSDPPAANCGSALWRAQHVVGGGIPRVRRGMSWLG